MTDFEIEVEASDYETAWDKVYKMPVEELVEKGKILSGDIEDEETEEISSSSTPFSHIKDCWRYLRMSKDYNDLRKRISDLPSWSGNWYIEKNAEGNCLVTNEYYDKSLEDYDEEQEDLDIPYLGDDDDLDDYFIQILIRTYIRADLFLPLELVISKSDRDTVLYSVLYMKR